VSPAIIAHGVGARGDLPLPRDLFVWGVSLALLISFLAMAVLWKQPVLDRSAGGRRLIPIPVSTGLGLIGRALALVLYAVCLWAGWNGANEINNNILPVALYVTVWVGGQLIGGLVGDVWGAVNPVDTVARGAEAVVRPLGLTEDEPGWGQWPAVVGMIVFLFYELSHPTGSTPRTLGLLLTVHLILTVVAAMMWGAAWVRRNDPFTALFALVGAMAPIYGADGEIRSRPPLTGLARVPVMAGTGALLLAAIGGTSFDGFSESTTGRDLFEPYLGWELAWFELAGLLISILAVTALFALGVWWTVRVTGMAFRAAWRAFTPSLIPIMFGYAVAHYFQLFADNIQAFVFRLSDPFGRGWDLFGGADGLIWQIDPDVVAWIQVTAMLAGHVGAVAAAHDRAVELFPPAVSLRSQFGMLAVMVAYSSLGLWLLLTA
jgi:hypothetical protein